LKDKTINERKKKERKKPKIASKRFSTPQPRAFSVIS